MKRGTSLVRMAAGVSTAAAFVLAMVLPLPADRTLPSGRSVKPQPADWFFLQRAFPHGSVDPELRRRSIEEARALQSAAQGMLSPAWQSRGPSNIGGRITTLAISRQHPGVLYAGAADGGVLKSTNGGVNWTALFDNQASLSIGAVALDPTNDNILYVGTGEANSSGDSYDGVGVVKTTNGGLSWFSAGLGESRRIGKIVVDPLNPATVYVAALGATFSPNPERGVYRSTDGGATWSHVLFVNDSTGVVDLTINPDNPSILLAAAWQRMRAPWGRRYVGGVWTGIYRTTNAGATWSLLTGGLPAPAPNVGRPAVAFAPSNPAVAYVAYADDPGYFFGVYRTANGGDTWARTNDGVLANLYSSFGWYFGKVIVSPFDENVVFVCGVPMARTTNGGAGWTITNTSHPDQHAVVFHPTNPAVIYAGNDGGFCRSTNGGSGWTRETDQDLFITQFYAGAIDFLNPARSLGGTQDNGSIRTLTGNADDWTLVNGGDGFYAAIDYTNNNYQYAESQYGALVRTINNWASILGATSGINASDRKNWSTPIVMDQNNPQVLYTGTQRVYKSTNRAASWVAISGDLTGGPLPGFSAYATVTTIDVARTDSQTIIAGTDDAHVWVTTNGGTGWTDVRAGLPNRWITRVRFDPTDRNIAYVTLSGYRLDSRLPHVFRTTNLGTTWQDISSNLPEAPVNVICVDPLYPARLYVGTDVGAYFTTNTGAAWLPMGRGLPNVVISDLVAHPPTRIARAFTHGRSLWELSLDQLITSTDGGTIAPQSLELLQNYPNPFNPVTNIKYSVPSGRDLVRGADGQIPSTKWGFVSLKVYDLLGREVATLLNEAKQPGTHTVQWDASQAASGVYFCRMSVTPAASRDLVPASRDGQAGTFSATRKLLLLR